MGNILKEQQGRLWEPEECLHGLEQTVEQGTRATARVHGRRDYCHQEGLRSSAKTTNLPAPWVLLEAGPEVALEVGLGAEEHAPGADQEELGAAVVPEYSDQLAWASW